MTVQINPPGGNLEDLARIGVDNLIKRAANFSYDTDLRKAAIDAVEAYQPAYVRLSDYSDQLSTNAAIWAMGGMLGLPNLDPPAPLRGLRQVANHMASLWPDDFDRKIRVVLRNLAAANAMAMLDRELLLEERAINRAEVDNWGAK